MRKRFAQCAVVVALQVLPALAATAPAWAADTMVMIHNFAFSPQRLTVKAGTTVVWENADDIPHTVVSGRRRSTPGTSSRSHLRHWGATTTFALCTRT
jgi:plastocyanin